MLLHLVQNWPNCVATGCGCTFSRRPVVLEIPRLRYAEKTSVPYYEHQEQSTGKERLLFFTARWVSLDIFSIFSGVYRKKLLPFPAINKLFEVGVPALDNFGECNLQSALLLTPSFEMPPHG